MLFLYLRIIQSIVLALRNRILTFDILVALPMDGAILLREVLRVGLYQLPGAGHPLADCLQRIIAMAILLQSRLFRSLDLFGTVRVAPWLMLHLGILVTNRP